MPQKPKDSAATKARIVEQLSEGVPLREICRDEGMPAWRTVYDWMDADEDFAAAIARARVSGFDAIASECLEIADDARNDWMDKRNAEGEVIGQQLDSEHVQRSKLRIETRLKLLAKWDPKRYGEKLQADITSDGGSIFQKIVVEVVKPA